MLKQVVLLFDGVFYYFGLMDNPADKKSKEIISQSISEKMKSDLRKINSDYRKQYKNLRKQVYCLGE